MDYARIKGIGIISWTVVLASMAAACGGGQQHAASNAAQAATSPEDLSFEADTVRPNDSEAPEAPPSSSAVSTAARRALDARHVSIAQCYATLLRTSADAVGRIAVDIAIGAEGHPTRVSARTEGEGGIGNARVCVENALRAMQMTGVPANGVRIRRSYSFVNPAVELTVADPITVNPPRRSTARTAAAATASASPSGPPEGATGPLTLAEVTPFVTTHAADLSACYATALRTARTASGAATFVLTVGGGGAVSQSAFQSEVPALATMSDCAMAAAHAWHFRASGTGATVHVSLAFAR